MRTLASKLLDGYDKHISLKTLLLREMSIILATGLLISETALWHLCWRDVADFGSCGSVIYRLGSRAFQMVRESERDCFTVKKEIRQTCISFVITGVYEGTRACREILR